MIDYAFLFLPTFWCFKRGKEISFRFSFMLISILTLRIIVFSCRTMVQWYCYVMMMIGGFE